MTLQFYLARRFAWTFATVLGIFGGLIFLTDMVEQVRRYDRVSITLGEAAGLAALNAPQTLHLILPLLMIIATVTLFLRLARTSELVVIRAAGRSAIRSLGAPVLVAFLIGLTVTVALNPIIAATTERYNQIVSELLYGAASTLSLGPEGLWLRQAADGGQIVIHATGAASEGSKLDDVTFLFFADAGTPTARIEAAAATLTPGEWQLSDVKRWTIDPGRNPETTADRPDAGPAAGRRRAARDHRDLGPARLHPEARDRRLQRARLPGLVPHGAGEPPLSRGNGADRCRVHHASHPFRQNRLDGASRGPYWIRHVLHEVVRTNPWRHRENPGAPRGVGSTRRGYTPFARVTAAHGRRLMTPLIPPSRALRALRRALAATALTALFALPAPLFAQDTATLLANAIRTNGAGQLVAEGAVEILYRDRRLQATRVVYDRTGDRISLTGPITLTQGDSVLILADEAELDSELRDGLLRSARLVLDREMQVAAREIRRSEARYTEATDTVASSCEVCAANPVPLWQIRAKTVRHDQEERQLYFRNARLEIAGVPVLYTPYLRLPDPTLQRATGFLVPSLRTTSNIGTGIALPYFVVLGDRADLTFTPSVTTGGSNTLFLTYRHAFASGELQFDGGLTDDRLRAGLRGYGRLQGRFDMPRDFELTFDLEDVSDGGYYRDYGLPEADRIDSAIALTRIGRDQFDEAQLTYFTSFRPS